jgi:hypothetical protein
MGKERFFDHSFICKRRKNMISSKTDICENDVATLNREFGYIRGKGGKPILSSSEIPEDKQKLIVWKSLGDTWNGDDMWWSNANINNQLPLLGNGNRIDDRMRELHHLLLSFGGDETCLPGLEEDLQKILNRGQLWLGDKVILKKGRPSQCHSNTAELYEANVNNHNVAIATGYALSSDGIWRQHSWLMWKKPRSVTVVETTVKRVLYFGFVMTPAEAVEFCDNNY